jgi:hypothetical protein
MIFSKYEIIVLTNKKKYIVLDIKEYNDKIFYKLKEVSENEKQLLDREMIVKAYSIDASIFIDLSTGDELEQVNKLFDNTSK